MQASATRRRGYGMRTVESGQLPPAVQQPLALLDSCPLAWAAGWYLHPNPPWVGEALPHQTRAKAWVALWVPIAGPLRAQPWTTLDLVPLWGPRKLPLDLALPPFSGTGIGAQQTSMLPSRLSPGAASIWTGTPGSLVPVPACFLLPSSGVGDAALECDGGALACGTAQVWLHRDL